jgi:hypothetical protein
MFLYINSVDKFNKSVTLFKGDKIIDELTDSNDILELVKKILRKNNLSLQDIDEFRLNTGPGSFTGIKIGVSIVNTLNYFLKGKKLSELNAPFYGREPEITKPKTPLNPWNVS